MHTGQPQIIEKSDHGYLLKLHLPFVRKEAIHLTRKADELAISIGNFRRNIILPHVLSVLDVQSARFEEDNLVIHFANSKAPAQ